VPALESTQSRNLRVRKQFHSGNSSNRIEKTQSRSIIIGKEVVVREEKILIFPQGMVSRKQGPGIVNIYYWKKKSPVKKTKPFLGQWGAKPIRAPRPKKKRLGEAERPQSKKGKCLDTINPPKPGAFRGTGSVGGAGLVSRAGQRSP